MLEKIRQKLQNTLQPSLLSVNDESHRHRGHAGYREGEVTHVHIEVVSSQFNGLSRLECQRKVYAILKDEIPQIHALTIKAMGHLPDKDGCAKV